MEKMKEKLFIKKEKKQEYSGYMTLEACFIVPIILCLIILIIYLGFYLYDRSLVVSLAYESALSGSRMYYNTKDEIEEWVRGDFLEKVQKQSLALDFSEEDLKVEVTATKVEVTFHGNVKTPVSTLLSTWLVDFDHSIDTTQKAGRVSGTRVIQFVQFGQNIKDTISQKKSQ